MFKKFTSENQNTYQYKAHKSFTLNQSDLISAATAEKNALIERLRGYFDETSRDKLLERRANENDFLQKELNKVPYTIYIG